MSEERVTEAIANSLREKVVRGDFGTSGRVASVAKIATEWSASRTTVYEALRLLQLEGVLLAKSGSFYANYPLHRIPGITPTFDEYLKGLGLTPLMENIIEPEVVAMPADIAKIFGQPEDALFVHRMRRQGSTEVPYRIAENWYPSKLAGEFLHAMQADPDLNVLGEIKRVHGAAIADTHEDVLGRIPTAEEARVLSLPRTAPVLEIRRSSVDRSGNPVMFNKIICVACYFQLSYDYKPNHWK